MLGRYGIGESWLDRDRACHDRSNARKKGTTMTAIHRRLVSLGLVLLLTAAAPAQRYNKSDPVSPLSVRILPALTMLVNKGVHRELAANDDQVAKLKDLYKSFREKLSDEEQKINILPEDERPAKAQQAGDSLMSELRKSLDGILTPEQMKRFFQVYYQLLGSAAFVVPEVRSNLGIGDEQFTRIREISSPQWKAAVESIQSGGEKAIAKTSKSLQLGTDKVLGILDGGQRESWKKLTGEPFEFEEDSPFGNRRKLP
jgi:hypothetical protein